MVSFPVFQRLHVDAYGLYPGTSATPGLQVVFGPGLTLVLGANGLGKTTLVTLLYRLCTGPYDLPALARSADLGGKSLEPRALPHSDRRFFAQRVMDGAKDAMARLEVSLGETSIAITRRLDSLALVALEIDGTEVTASESSFQQRMTAAAGVASFGDWLLILRHLTFYFEDRRALVWDESAQRQLLRVLFLPPDTAGKWTTLEREILTLDSRMRNLQAVLTKEQETVEEAHAATENADALREELAALELLQRHDREVASELDARAMDTENELQAARLFLLQSEQSREHTYRELERAQLRAIASSFPDRDATARYLYAKLLVDGRCVCCGNATVELADKRLRSNDCLICGSPVSALARPRRPSARLSDALANADTQLAAARARLTAAESEHADLIAELTTLNATVAARDASMMRIVRRLPPDAQALHKQYEELALMRSRVASQKQELESLRSEFLSFIDGVNQDIAMMKAPVQDSFSEFAHGFLLDQCTLVWQLHKARLGQTGAQIDFPGFELELGGTDFVSPVRRSGPDQVSESQREFIDLSFRMALMQVSGTAARGSLVIDAPESSLDAVFVTRAADVLSRFAEPNRGNRLVVTSNLIEGNLIPELLRKAGIKRQSDSRLVDLLKLAAPTAATHALASEYVALRKRLFASAT